MDRSLVKRDGWEGIRDRGNCMGKGMGQVSRVLAISHLLWLESCVQAVVGGEPGREAGLPHSRASLCLNRTGKKMMANLAWYCCILRPNPVELPFFVDQHGRKAEIACGST